MLAGSEGCAASRRLALSTLEPKRYLLLSKDDLPGEFAHAGPATLAGVYLSSIALIAHLEIEQPGTGVRVTSEPLRSNEEHGPLKSQLRVLMRSLLMRLREHGVDCPAVALLSPRGVRAREAEAVRGDFLTSYTRLQSDQGWHRGEFLVFVTESREKATARLQDLLAPEPPRAELSHVAQVLPDVIAEGRQAAVGNQLLGEILEAWYEEFASCEKEGEMGAPMDRRCAERGVVAIDERVQSTLKRASSVLEKLA